MTSKERPRLQQQHGKRSKPQRVRVTHKALESRQFSTVRLPRTSEVSSQKVDVNSMYQELEGRLGHPSAAGAATGKPSSTASAAPSPSPAVFDPIIQDPMFTVVASSDFWPPPSLEELHAKTGRDHGDGFDSYDRREDDKLARKERTKVIKGEINHPRGKPRRNAIVKLSDSASDNDGGQSDSDTT